VALRDVDHDGAQRQIYEEDRPPRNEIYEPPPKERPDSSGDAAQAGPRPDRASAIVGMERGLDDREARRRQKSAAYSL
jgi:hypothetical protein